MRILVDENIPNVTVSELRTKGHDVLDIRGTEHQGMFDDELWPFAQTAQRMRSTVTNSITAYWSSGYANRTNNGFTRVSWRRRISSPITIGQDCSSSCAIRFRAFIAHVLTSLNS
jgi:hypothetical protein